MEEDSSTSENSITSRKFDDPAWAHAKLVVGMKNHIICLYCDKHLKGGGITRLKKHLAGIKGDVKPCKKVSHNIKWQMKTLLEGYKNEKERRQRINYEVGSGSSVGVGEGAIERTEGNMPTQEHVIDAISNDMRKRRRQMSSLFAPSAEVQLSPFVASQSKQTAYNVKMAMAKWWYDAGVPFNAAQSCYYQPMVDAIASYGLGYEAPSIDDYRGNLLSNCVSEIKSYLSERKKTWATYGCSVMCDSWINRKHEPIINFLVYSIEGTIFLKSVDMSGLVKNADTLLEIFDEVVTEIGPENIVQFITDNDAIYKVAGKRLQNKYNSFCWTPCAARCIDLMLENIGDGKYFPIIDETVQKARKVTRFIYNHVWVLNLMRKDFTNGRNLCRPAISRFATNFLSLQCFIQMKKELRQMFTSEKWVTSQYAKSNIGIEVSRIILEDDKFWSQCQFVIRICEPLLKVLRLVDSDEKSTMSYFYDAMERAKEAIKINLKNMSSLYTPYLTIINERWEKQLCSPLFAAGAFLNPSIYFNPSFTKRIEVSRAMLYTIITIVSNDEMQDLLSSQIEAYKDSCGFFGMPLAIRQRNRLNPVVWWDQFGSDVPELQKFAIQILSQCVSATGCEKNWSTFEYIHSKKQNRLEYKRLNDLIFVRYNLKLQERTGNRTRGSIKPICLDHVDLLKDWISEKPNRTRGSFDPICVDHVDLLKDWISEEPNFINECELEDDLGWENIDLSFDALSLNDGDDNILLNDEDFVPIES